MKVNVIKHLSGNNSIVGWAFITAITEWQNQNGKPNGIDEQFMPVNEEVDIVMTVNGVEVPFITVMELYQAQIDDMISRRAHDILAEKASGILDTVYELERNLKYKADELFPEYKNDRW